MAENPFDLGSGAGPVDPSAFQAAKEAWYADRDRLVADVLPRVDRAIANVESWANTVNNLSALVGTLVPLVQTLVTQGLATKQTLTDARQACDVLNLLRAKLLGT